MHGKWERKRKKTPRIAILVLAVATILLALFLTKDLWLRNEDKLPAEKMATSESTENMDSTTEPSETESVATKSVMTEPELIEEQLIVINAYVNEDNHMILVYSNGKEMDTGPVDSASDNTQGKFKVEFRDYYGTVLKEEYVSSGESAVPPTAPILQGYVFVGWDGSYTDITSDVVLTALYMPGFSDTTTYTVCFVDYDDVVLKVENVLEGTAATAPGNPLRTGYEFIGWDMPFDEVTSDLMIKAQYEAYSGPEVVIEDVEATAGSENVAVTLRVKNNPGIASLKFLMEFDKNLTLTEIEYNPELGGHSMLPQTMKSPVTLNWVSPFENKTGDWVFATLYFKVADSAKGVLPITASYDPNDIFDLTETNIKFRVNNGAIIVP